MTTTVAPARSRDQLLAQLEVANDVRQRRARLRRQVRSGEVTLTELLASPPEWLENARAAILLRMVTSVGEVKAHRIMNRIRIAESKTVGELSRRQRDALVEWLDGR